MPAWGLQEEKLGRWEGRRVKSLPAPCQHSPFSRQPSAPSAARRRRRRRQLLIQAVGASALHGEGSAFFSCSASFFAVQNTVSPGKEVRAKAGGPETWDHRPSRNSAQTERGSEGDLTNYPPPLFPSPTGKGHKQSWAGPLGGRAWPMPSSGLLLLFSSQRYPA